MLQASSAISPVQGAVLGTADRQVKPGVFCVLGQQSPRLEVLAEGGTHTGEPTGIGLLSLLFLLGSLPTPMWRVQPAQGSRMPGIPDRVEQTGSVQICPAKSHMEDCDGHLCSLLIRLRALSYL